MTTFDTMPPNSGPAVSREQILHLLYEAAELEHSVMCTYLYAAFSPRDGEAEGLSSKRETEAVARFRQVIAKVAVEEMGHLAAVWNITAALGASPRFGRGNFPLGPGELPAGIVVKLAPFSDAVLQHFIYLERPAGFEEPDGAAGFPGRVLVQARRRQAAPRLVPMALDYDTVGVFYETLDAELTTFVARVGESAAFCGDPALQLSPLETGTRRRQTRHLPQDGGARRSPRSCSRGEGAPLHLGRLAFFSASVNVREELAALRRENPGFSPAFPAAVNPVLRPPVRDSGRVWIEDERAAKTVDLANTGYALMLRLLAYSYARRRDRRRKRRSPWICRWR